MLLSPGRNTAVGHEVARREQPGLRERRIAVGALGVVQILSWGTSYYLPAILVAPIMLDTGWSATWVTGGLSAGLLTAASISPAVSRAIVRFGGRNVLAGASAFLASGLLTMSLSTSLTSFMLGWILMGCGMAAGLYDAAFATLGELFGASARRSISALTLYGGFASTVCWPLSAFLIAEGGWRFACLAYALVHLLICAPLLFACVPLKANAAPSRSDDPPPERRAVDEPAFLMLSAALCVSAFVSSMIAVQLLTLLQAAGASLATAVALGILIGPAQVAARIVEMFFGKICHPLWTMLASSLLMTTGLALFGMGHALGAAALILYAAGNGVWSISRGSVPLALFGAPAYSANMGRLVRPALLASACAPLLAGWIYEHGGLVMSRLTLLALSALTLLIVIGLFIATRKHRLEDGATG